MYWYEFAVTLTLNYFELKFEERLMRNINNIVCYVYWRCISTLIVNYLELNVDVRLMRSVDNIGCYVH